MHFISWSATVSDISVCIDEPWRLICTEKSSLILVFHLKEFGDSKIRGEGALHTFKQHSNWISFNPLRFVSIFTAQQIQHDIPKRLLTVYKSVCKKCESIMYTKLIHTDVSSDCLLNWVNCFTQYTCIKIIWSPVYSISVSAIQINITQRFNNTVLWSSKIKGNTSSVI